MVCALCQACGQKWKSLALCSRSPAKCLISFPFSIDTSSRFLLLLLKLPFQSSGLQDTPPRHPKGGGPPMPPPMPPPCPPWFTFFDTVKNTWTPACQKDGSGLQSGRPSTPKWYQNGVWKGARSVLGRILEAALKKTHDVESVHYLQCFRHIWH